MKQRNDEKEEKWKETRNEGKHDNEEINKREGFTGRSAEKEERKRQRK